jgi:septum formation protein
MLLEEMGFDFEILAPDIDEKAIRSENVRELPLIIAQAKMDEVLKHVEGDAVVITSDQVMIVEGVVREKPSSKEEAYTFIKTYSSTPQVATSGTVVVNTKTGERVFSIDEVIVTFDPIPEDHIKTFVESGDAFNYAGGLAAEHKLFLPYVHYEGEWETLLGLPRAKTLKMIRQVFK